MEKVRNINSSEQSQYFRINIKKLIDPFLTVTDTNNPDHIGIEVAIILDCNENYMLSQLRKNNMSALIYSRLIKKVKKALKEKKISKDAPWFKELTEKMITLELFIASTDKEMDLKKGKEDIRDLLDHAGKEEKRLKERLDSSPTDDDSGKK